MDPALSSFLAFCAAAGLLTVTPGLDTALVLRTAATEGPKPAFAAALGIAGGCVAWAALVALGLGALLTASEIAYRLLRWVGAAYLVWLGLQLLLKPRRAFAAEAAGADAAGPVAWLRRGFLTNMLNPKVGVFYVAFLPQFVPAGADAAVWSFALALVHVGMGTAWFALLIRAAGAVSGLFARKGVVTWLDRITGGVFLGFGARLAFEARS